MRITSRNPSRSLVMGFILAILAVFAAFLLTPRLAAADGVIIPDPPPDRVEMRWRDIPMTIKYHRVEVTIVDQVATTHVDQVFVNDASFAVEGTYIFPLPEDAAISSFDMTVDGVKYEGRLLGRDEARAIYEEIVRTRRDPALLEYVGRGAFQARIFPIPPGGERRIELVYSQVLEQEDGLVHYRYPLNAEKFSARPISQVSVSVEISDRALIRAVYSPSHPIEVTRHIDRTVTASYEASDVQPDRDFDLFYSLSPSEGAITVNLLSYKASGEDGFFLLLVAPPVETVGPPPPKDVVLVFDTSGSMEGRKMEQARAAARYVLDHLGPDDRFNIIGFGTGVRLFDAASQPLSRRDEGQAFIDKLEAAGGTNISRALGEALAGADPVRSTIVIFMTDGLPTAGETDPDRIVAGVTGSAPKSTRLFAFGVGYDVDTVLLDQLSSALRGVSAYVKPGESIEEAVSGLYQKVSAPVLMDVEARFSGVQTDDLYPYPLPDLFAGSQLVVAGRYRAGGTASLDLTGTVDGQPRSYRYGGLRFVERGGDEFIPRLWAQRAVGYLLSQIRLHGARNELVKAVVDLSVRYGIITPYTSFLVEEPAQAAAQAPRPPSAPAEPPRAPEPGRPSAPTSAPAPVVIETVVVEKQVEKLVAPAERSGAEAVQRAEVEKELSTEGHAALPAAPGEVRQVGDKAFVQRGAIWVDTEYDAATMKAEAIEFGSGRYFELLAQNPDIGPYLALGENVILVIEGRAYAIGPDAGAAASSVPAVRSASAIAPTTLPAAATAVPGTVATPTPQRGPAPCPGAAVVLLAAVGLLAPVWRRTQHR